MSISLVLRGPQLSATNAFSTALTPRISVRWVSELRTRTVKRTHLTSAVACDHPGLNIRRVHHDPPGEVYDPVEILRAAAGSRRLSGGRSNRISLSCCCVAAASASRTFPAAIMGLRSWTAAMNGSRVARPPCCPLRSPNMRSTSTTAFLRGSIYSHGLLEAGAKGWPSRACVSRFTA